MVRFGGGRFLELLKKYGKVALGVHFQVFAASITGLYVAINNNVDVESLLDKFHLGGLSDKDQTQTIPPQNPSGYSSSSSIPDGSFMIEKRTTLDDQSTMVIYGSFMIDGSFMVIEAEKRNQTVELVASMVGHWPWPAEGGRERDRDRLLQWTKPEKMIVCAAVVGHQNNPLYIQSFTEADDALKLHHIVHCSLDVVDERVNNPKKSRPTLNETFLGLLYPTENYRVYGYLTNTKVKFILVTMDLDVRDADFFRRFHAAYVDAVSNPFHVPDKKITSRTFAERVSTIVKSFGFSAG
ncbi:trafficking protein particle complex subunit 2-like protein [Quillaja saponaria]|uniref:Trafficking protein particle complex subunit 2-like protein n=1 Tax=Quillaja saponaria TaxID=32244 RepID=A0AAD7PTB3_QUISA|nr:trafficking protein particle complex subunit 2-like protein [Quillaja saponaria]